MQWPDYFPDNCPPDTAQPASGVVYFFVTNAPPIPDDFRSKRQKNPTLRFPRDKKECQACGISIFTEIDDLLSLRKQFPAFRKLKVARGNLTPDLGLMLQTPSQGSNNSHHTLWLTVDAQPWLVFQAIDLNE